MDIKGAEPGGSERRSPQKLKQKCEIVYSFRRFPVQTVDFMCIGAELRQYFVQTHIQKNSEDSMRDDPP